MVLCFSTIETHKLHGTREGDRKSEREREGSKKEKEKPRVM